MNVDVEEATKKTPTTLALLACGTSTNTLLSVSACCHGLFELIIGIWGAVVFSALSVPGTALIDPSATGCPAPAIVSGIRLIIILVFVSWGLYVLLACTNHCNARCFRAAHLQHHQSSPVDSDSGVSGGFRPAVPLCCTFTELLLRLCAACLFFTAFYFGTSLFLAIPACDPETVVAFGFSERRRSSNDTATLDAIASLHHSVRPYATFSLVAFAVISVLSVLVPLLLLCCCIACIVACLSSVLWMIRMSVPALGLIVAQRMWREDAETLGHWGYAIGDEQTIVEDDEIDELFEEDPVAAAGPTSSSLPFDVRRERQMMVERIDVPTTVETVENVPPSFSQEGRRRGQEEEESQKGRRKILDDVPDWQPSEDFQANQSRIRNATTEYIDALRSNDNARKSTAQAAFRSQISDAVSAELTANQGVLRERVRRVMDAVGRGSASQGEVRQELRRVAVRDRAAYEAARSGRGEEEEQEEEGRRDDDFGVDGSLPPRVAHVGHQVGGQEMQGLEGHLTRTRRRLQERMNY